MIREIEDAIIARIENANLGFKEVMPLGADIDKIWTQISLWPAAIVGYDGGVDKPQTSENYQFEKDYNVFIVAKNLRKTSEARDNIYSLIDRLRELFSGVTGQELGVEYVDIIHPTTDEPVALEKNRVLWALRLRVIGRR